MSSTALDVQNVSKRYASYRSNLQRFATWFGIHATPVAEYWAVRDISFSLGRGEALALIGQNGAGKSTLLKIITGTVRPTTGHVRMAGKVAAILELGLGFNPEFSGRENVYRASGLMGLSNAQIDALVPDIQAFSELEEFFDQPMRTYSSGMQARLAFSIVTAVRPDVLIVDEVLSVGDSYFQHKSFERIRRFKEAGTSILFVSHSMTDVRSLCDRVILIDKGQALRDGSPDEVVDYYNALIAEKEEKSLSIRQQRQANGWLVTEYGDKSVVAESLELLDERSGRPVSVVRVGQALVIETRAHVKRDVARLVLGHKITDRTGNIIWGTNTWHTKQVLKDLKEGTVVTFRVSFDCPLGPGSYALCFGLVSSETHLEDCFHRKENLIVFDVVNSDKPIFIGSTWIDAKIAIAVEDSRSRPLRIAIVSTPRSGNTWLRYLLGKLYDTEDLVVHHPQDVDWGRLSGKKNTILQLHWPPTDEFISLLNRHQFRILVLLRHPLDVLISILHFAPREPQTALWLAGQGGDESPIHGKAPISPDFIEYAKGERAKALLGVSAAWSRLDDIIRIRYEDLAKDPATELEKLISQLGPPKIDGHSVIEEMSIDNLRSGSTNHHFWKGEPGIWKRFLPKKVAEELMEAQADVFAQLGYDCGGARDLDNEVADGEWYNVCQ